MIQHPDDRRPPLSPQLATRVALLGGVALVAFAIIFFRLWYLQVLSGQDYKTQAQRNRVRSLVTQAPRGEILDRDGNVLATSRPSGVIEVDYDQLPKSRARREAIYRRLARTVGGSTRPQRCLVGRRHVRVTKLECLVDQQHLILPYASVPVKTDAPGYMTSYIGERQPLFPGVTAGTQYLREYPFKTASAQVVGTVGQINDPELHQKHFKGVKQGTQVGQSGLEYEYDRYLRGRNGAERVAVDALGNAVGSLAKKAPIQGKNLRLSLDLGLTQEGLRALQTGIGLASDNGAYAGAFVAMDPHSGAIYGMGSLPSFDPNIFAKPVLPAVYKRINDPVRAPLTNRAVGSVYPTGSTFKLVTATAALASGAYQPGEIIVDTGELKLAGLPKPLRNAGDAIYGPLTLPQALTVSSDIFFYRLGKTMNSPRPRGGALQKWAGLYGFGHTTGIDLPAQAAGTVPSPAWRVKLNDQERACLARKGRTQPCLISDLRTWAEGDNVNLAVGQGDLQASPLQMATAYSALVEGGRVPTPHIGLQIEDAQGHILQTVSKPAARHIPIPAAAHDEIMQGLYGAANSAGGTSVDVWKGFPKQYQVFGKTGTAERGIGRPDQSWYVCYIKAGARSIVIAVTVERGGFGAATAAPVARLIASQWLGVKKKLVLGSDKTR